MNEVILTSVILLIAYAASAPAEDRESEANALAALNGFQPAITRDQTKLGKPVVRIVFLPNIVKKVADGDLVHSKNLSLLRSVHLGSRSASDAGCSGIDSQRLY